jgi:altronate hydrolase
MQTELIKQQVLKVHPADNVMVALTDLSAGETIQYGTETYSLIENIPQKHKFATTSLETGDPVIMYGVLVGKALKPIRKGGLMGITVRMEEWALPITGYLFQPYFAKTVILSL